MSKLEQLAKQRAVQRQQTTSVVGETDINPSTKSVSLLNKLRTGNNNGETAKLSLSERLILSKVKPASLAQENNSILKSNSLSSRLHNLQAKNQKAKEQQTTTGPLSKEPATNERRIIQDESEELKRLKQLLFRFQSIKSKDLELKQLRSQVSQPSRHIPHIFNNNEVYPITKERNQKLNTVYYPHNKKSKIEQNFLKLSPDDLVSQAQTQAFENVAKKVSTLSIKPPKRLQKKLTEESIKHIDASLYITKNSIQPTMSIVTLGHTNSGKSTFIGKLLYDLGIVKIQDVNDLKIRLERSSYKDDANLYWSWIMDYDRKNGTVLEKTIRTKTFNYAKYNYRIIDVPGTRSSVDEDLFRSINNADLGILVIDCSTDGFESGFNLNGQIIEHCILLYSHGISRIIIAMNKLDTVDWYEERYQEIKRELLSFLKNIGFKEDQLNWVPCCTIINTKEDGIFKTVYKQMCPWYSDGRSVLDILQNQNIEISNTKKKDVEKKVIISVDTVISSRTCSGFIKSGSVQNGDIIKILPNERIVTVSDVYRENRKVPIAIAGDYISLEIEEEGAEIAVGNIISSLDDSSLTIIKPGVMILDVEILMAYETEISVGSKFRLFINGSGQDIKVSKILNRHENMVKIEAENNDAIIIMSDYNTIAIRNGRNRTIGICKVIL